jgi:uncharacterized protein
MSKAKRPAPFLTAQWRYLVMLNYEVEPLVLSNLIPAGTELDRWNGKTFISIVGFRFLKTRVLNLPLPFHRNFDEVNLRYYVRRDSVEGARHGVAFIKEIVPRAAIAWVARTIYNENYIALPMRHRIAPPTETEQGAIVYEWKHRGRWNRMAVQTNEPAYLPDQNSEETFITEHYWGYARQRDGSTVEYEVEHPRWNVWRASEIELDCDAASIYGEQFAQFMKGEPSSAFVADGSGVIVRRGRKLS